jgi:hypothetical protein
VHGLHTNPGRKRRKKKKKNSFPAKLHQFTIHVPSGEKEDTKNLTMQRKRQYNYQSQPPTPPKVGRVADAMVGALHVPTTFLFFLITQNQKCP